MKNSVFFRLALLFFGIILIPWKASTQDFHFAYIQSENKQPFYVLFENRNIPSSSSGYVILSKLEDGSYPLRVGFKGAQLQDYVLSINAGDLGFVIKDFGENGWGLLNMQTAAVQMSGEESGKIQAALAAQKAAEEKRVTDSVDAALAAAQEAQRAADALQAEAVAQQLLIGKLALEKHITDSLNEKIAARETKWKADSLKAALKMQRAAEKAAEQAKQKETAAAKNTTAKNTGAKTTAVAEPAAEISSAIIAAPVAIDKASSKSAKNTATKSKSTPPVKLSQSVSDAGLVMLYADGADTVNAFIPYSNEAPVKTSPVTTEEKPVIDTVVKVSADSKNQKTAPKKAVAVAGKKGTTVKPRAVPKTAEIYVSSDSAKAEPVLKPDTAVATVATPVEAQKTAPKKAVDVAGKKGKTAKPKAVASAVVIASEPGQTEQPVIKQDTVAIVAKPVETKEVETASVIPVVEPAGSTTKKKKTSGITSNNSNTKIVTVTPPPAAADSSVATAVEGNPACKAQAADKDFYSLRKRMIANDDPDNMISTAKKAFKEKCYSTTQVRNLCVLFLSDSERYMFLDTAYPYTSDNLNFGKLSDLLQDDYYVRRFKAMLK